MLLRALGPSVALVGWTDDPNAPIGQWHRREIDGVVYDFFATDHVPEPLYKRHLIPARAKNFFDFKRYGRAILSCGIKNILTQEPTVMMALPFFSDHNVAFWFPGVEPTLSVSRYPGAKYFANLFESLLIRALRKHAKLILAAADQGAIESFYTRCNGRLNDHKIVSFPTRVDTSTFQPSNKETARLTLKLPVDEIVCVTTGRLHRAKGWPLLLDAMEIFCLIKENAKLVFIGEGSDKKFLESVIKSKNLSTQVILAGQKSQQDLALYLQAADLFIMGSEAEGWSTSLVEALATGLPIVSSRFSSADSMIKNGVNGFVVDRDPKVFAQAMVDALKLENVKGYSLIEIKKYALSNLKDDLDKVWQC